METSEEFEYRAVLQPYYGMSGAPFLPLPRGLSADTHLAMRGRVSSISQSGRAISCMNLKEIDHLHKPSLVRKLLW